MTGEVKATTQRLLVEIHRDDDWLIAEIRLADSRHEICRMIAPSRDAALRTEIMKCFNALASKIIESIIRDDQPEADIVVREINIGRPGHG